MTRQLDLQTEVRQTKRHKALVRALEFELDGSLSGAGVVFTGFSIKYEEWECLLTLRGVVDGQPSIAFVGAEDMVGCILKTVRAAQSDKLRWRGDRYKVDKD